MSKEKESAVVPETEQLINCLDEHIRNIVRDEISRMTWRDLQARFPELVQELRAKFPAQVPD